jgi:hypothetical protein
MASDPVEIVRSQVALRVAEIRSSAPRLSLLALHAKIDSLRQLASDHGMPALERLAHCSAQLALLPGHRIATQSFLERVDEALEGHSAEDCTAILAALAARLH